jgi:hypothetical protein
MEPNIDKYITLDGALRWALAHEEAVRGGASRQTIETLEALGFNLGLRKIEKVGEDVVFNPLRHEDIRSGLLPDDRANVHTTGWQYGHRVIVRAKVY